MITALIAAFYLIIGLFDLVPLRKTNKRKEIAVYVLLMVASFGFGMLQLHGILKTNMEEIIGNLLSPLTE